jgi:hypothetical protein
LNDERSGLDVFAGFGAKREILACTAKVVRFEGHTIRAESIGRRNHPCSGLANDPRSVCDFTPALLTYVHGKHPLKDATNMLERSRIINPYLTPYY